MSAIRHARGGLPLRPLAPRVSRPGARSRSRAAATRTRRRRRTLLRAAGQLATVLGTIGVISAGARAAIGTISTVGGDSTIATVTPPVVISALSPSQAAAVRHRTGTAPATLLPGGPSVQLPVAVRNPGTITFTISRLVPDDAAFPARCPLTSWSVDTHGLLPTLPPHSSATVTVEVSLRTGAPATCSGTTVRFPMTVEGIPQ